MVISPECDVILTKYCGATQNGNRMTEVPFFVDYLMRRYALNLELDELNGHPISDYKMSICGLLTSPHKSSDFVRTISRDQVTKGDVSGMYFNMEAVCTAAAVGNLVIMLGTGSGARIHELQQIRVDEGYIGYTKDGRIWVKAQAKGEKRGKAELTKHILERDVTPIWLALARKYTGRGEFGIVKMQHGTTYGLSVATYLFQWDARALRQTDLNCLLRFAAHGTQLIDPKSGQQMSLCECLFRPAYGRVRKQAGHSIRAIQRALNHNDAQMTRYYLQDADGTPPSVQLSPLNDWDALVGRHVL